MKTLVLAAAAVAIAIQPLMAQPGEDGDQTPEAAQEFLKSAIVQWGRLSNKGLEAHYKINAASAGAGNCSTVVRYGNGGVEVISWKDAGTVSTKDINRSPYRYMLKVQLPPSTYVQLYFSSDDIMRRSLVAAEFLKGYCSGAF